MQSVKSFKIERYPAELKSKIYLLKHFERYILDRLYGDYPFTWEDVYRTSGMDFVQKYLRMKHVILFQLSNGALQVIFFFGYWPSKKLTAVYSSTSPITRRLSSLRVH